MSECIWRGSNNPRAIRGRHDDEGCVDQYGDPDQYCKGCLPCPERHCVVCGMRHAMDQTCPDCLAEVRENLDAITDCLVRLKDQALNGSTMTGSGAVKPEAASEIPGGEAMVELGPWSTGEAATDPSQRALERVRPDATISHALASWAQDWTESAGGTARHPLTPDHVTWASRHHAGFSDFATEMRQCRARIEDMVHLGSRTMTGAPCFMCHRPLERVYGKDDASDQWWCDRCKRSLGVGEYVTEVGKNYRAKADWLTVEDIAETYRVTRGSVSGWASAGYVRKKSDMNTGRMVYNVADILAKRDGRAQGESA